MTRMQTILFTIAALVIYFGIIGIIAKDVIDRVRAIKRHNKHLKD